MSRRTLPTTDTRLGRWLGPMALMLLAAYLLQPVLFPRQSERTPPEPHFVAEFSPKLITTKAIEDIRVGDRVLGTNPEMPIHIDLDLQPEMWRKVTLEMGAVGDGDYSRIVLLRPLSWIEDRNAVVGGSIDVTSTELRLEGSATVVSIEPCPPIETGSGNVVTGTFVHTPSEPLVEVYLQGQDEPLRCTHNHAFWSDDRLEFVEAGRLVKGEMLRTRSAGLVPVALVSRGLQPEQVYNLEVFGENVYEVSALGVLVHNNCGIGKYKDVGGHHIHNQALFSGSTRFSRAYDGDEAITISMRYIEDHGWHRNARVSSPQRAHQLMTNKQRELYGNLYRKRHANPDYQITWKDHNDIAVESLMAGGATREEARDLVAYSLRNLREQGAEPDILPWRGQYRW